MKLLFKYFNENYKIINDPEMNTHRSIYIAYRVFEETPAIHQEKVPRLNYINITKYI